MRRILLSVAAVGLTLALAATAEAGPKNGSNNHSTNSKGSGGNISSSHQPSNSHDYYLTFGSKLKNGSYFYKGKEHSHWSYRCWDDRYGCYCYWDGGLGCYYYWCEPDCCYYPISYCPYGKFCW
jgi:hypothetical protein